LDAEVNVYIYNLAGEMVKKLGPVSSVESNINWDCLTDSSKKVASGLYVYRIVVSGNGQQVSQIGKFAIIK